MSVLFATSFLACKKEEDEGKLPNISFKTGGTYVATNQNVAKSSSHLVGISASKSEANDVLKKFTVKVSYNGAADSTIVNMDLTGTQGDTFSYDMPVISRSVVGTEKYTYTVINRDGLVNSVNLTFTVQ